MPRHTERDARCLIYTYKEGLLSAIAHDLELEVGRFTIEIDESTRAIQATFAADSIKVNHPMKGGRPNPSLLGPAYYPRIEANMRTDVLEVARYKTIRFESTRVDVNGDEVTIEGALELHGNTKTVALTGKKRGDAWEAEVELHQPDFGIRVYSAMMGTLKIKPTVTVRLRVPV